MKKDTVERKEVQAAEALLYDRLEWDLVDVLESGGDFAEALLVYLRDRDKPKLLFSPENLSRIAALAEEHDPEESAWEQEIADNAVEGRLYGASNAYCRRFLDVHTDDFDFSTFDHFDPQTIHGLNRHRWFASLGRTLWATGDRKYFDALMREWDFFVERVPFPGEEYLRIVHAIGERRHWTPYWELDMFIRLNNWYYAYWLALHSEFMTPERNMVLLARCLQQFDLVAARGVRVHHDNFTAMQMEALYVWAASLPEATGMTVWKHAARNIMEGSMREAVWEDGVQWEKSASYHVGCIRWYGTSYLLGLRNEEPWAEEYGARLKAMGAYVDAIVTPDGNTPLLSDSDRTAGWRAGLSLLRCIFPDLTFRNTVSPTYFSLWASDGLEWASNAPQAPEESHVDIFPDGGVGVAGTLGGSEGSMVILDNGPTLAGHSHRDNLTIHYEAFGKPVIVDPGRWMYRGDADRNWVTRPHSHNTLVREAPRPLPWTPIEELSFETIFGPEDPRVGAIEQDDEDGNPQLTTSFRGYASNHAALVTRRVIMSGREAEPWLIVTDRIEDTEDAPWTNAWLFPASAPAERRDNGWIVRLDSGLSVGMSAYPHDLDMRDEEMFWCPNYGEKSPARWIRFFSTVKETTRIFVFVPSQGEPVIPKLSSASVSSALSAVSSGAGQAIAPTSV